MDPYMISGMDTKKRNYLENTSDDDGELKRYRGNDIIVPSRLLVSKQDFAKIIGKGGQMISNIRSSFGVELKGFDVNDNQRLISILGKFSNTIEAFDAVAEVLYNSFMARMQSIQPTVMEQFALNLMVDNELAGKIIGAKGAMINVIRSNSGVTQAKMHKDVQLIADQSMRMLQLEGSLISIRRLYKKLYVKFVVIPGVYVNNNDSPE